jgi:DNA-binding PadR family transcriptional regulator
MNEKTAKLANRLGRRLVRVIRRTNGREIQTITDVGRELRREWTGTPRNQRHKLRRKWENQIRQIDAMEAKQRAQ